MMKTKVCAECGREFAPRHGNQRYCSPECREKRKKENKERYRKSHREERCEYDRKYYLEHRDERREYNRKYRQEHLEKWREYSGRYYHSHREERREYGIKYREDHREERREYDRKYYLEHRDERREYNKGWRERNREKVEAYRFWYRNGGYLEVMARKDAEDRAEALKPDEALDLAGVMEAADDKPGKCPFDGSCFDCPYPDCIVE